VPVKARVILRLFRAAAVLMAVHTAISPKDASLHLKLQHGFHEAEVSLWVDGDLASSGRVTGAARKKFGRIPTDSMQGSLSQIVAVRCGQHKIRMKIEPGDGAAQEDSIKGDFSSNAERDLLVSAHRSSTVVELAKDRWHSGRNVVELYRVVALCWLLFSDYGGISHVGHRGICAEGTTCPTPPRGSDAASNSVVSKNG
jgi:hypothetical protein